MIVFPELSAIGLKLAEGLVVVLFVVAFVLTLVRR